MGCINSAEASSSSQSADDSKNTLKLTLLGISGSGKSTMSKQMRCLFGTGFDEEERAGYKTQLAANIIIAFTTIGSYCEDASIDIKNKKAKKALAFFQSQAPYTTEFSQQLVSNAKDLWKTAQEYTSQMGKFDYLESLTWIMQNIDKISAEDYVSTNEDLIRIRLRTTGFNETKFKAKKHSFCLVDVGGHKSERRKWEQASDGSHAIIFFASLDDYNLKSFDNPEITRLQESLDLWEQLATSATKADIPVILFLNKLDLFQEKLEKFPLSDAYSAYKGENDVNEAVEFIKSRFLRRIPKENKERLAKLQMYSTCAINTENLKAVTDKAFEFIIEQRLTAAGINPEK